MLVNEAPGMYSNNEMELLNRKFGGYVLSKYLIVAWRVVLNKYVMGAYCYHCTFCFWIGLHDLRLNYIKTKKMELVDGGHLEFWYLDSSKYKNDARNGLSMPHLIGKVILRGFLWPFTFKLHFSLWPQAAILNFDGWTGQNTKTMTEMGSPCQN